MNATAANTNELLSRTITQWLRGLYDDCAAKRLARDAQVDVRTAESWLAGASGPRAVQFVRLAAQHKQLLVEIAMLDGGE